MVLFDTNMTRAEDLGGNKLELFWIKLLSILVLIIIFIRGSDILWMVIYRDFAGISNAEEAVFQLI